MTVIETRVPRKPSYLDGGESQVEAVVDVNPEVMEEGENADSAKEGKKSSRKSSRKVFNSPVSHLNLRFSVAICRNY